MSVLSVCLSVCQSVHYFISGPVCLFMYFFACVCYLSSVSICPVFRMFAPYSLVYCYKYMYTCISLSYIVQDSSGDVGEGYTKLQERFLDMYIEYLKTLHFHPIEERERQPSTHPLSHSLYKCLQRSFSGGIVLIELSFQTSLFHVKLFSLESSRLSNVPPFSNEVHATACVLVLLTSTGQLSS